MRILMLAALLATGLCAQTQPPVVIQPEQAQRSQWISAPGKVVVLDSTVDAAAAPQQPQVPQSQPGVNKAFPWVGQLRRAGGTPNFLTIRPSQPASQCAIPLLNVAGARSFTGDPKMPLPAPRLNPDPKMVIHTMPVCPQR